MKIYVFFRFWSKNFGNLEFIGKKNKKYLFIIYIIF